MNNFYFRFPITVLYGYTKTLGYRLERIWLLLKIIK